MQKWRRSHLIIGEELRIPKELFIEKEKSKARLTSCKYIGETDAGIIIDCFFIPPFGHKQEDSHYRMMINWASIYCGNIKVFYGDGERLIAQRIEV